MNSNFLIVLITSIFILLPYGMPATVRQAKIVAYTHSKQSLTINFQLKRDELAWILAKLYHLPNNRRADTSKFGVSVEQYGFNAAHLLIDEC